MKPLLIVIDGNSIAHANHNTTKLTVGDFEVQAIFGFLRSLRFIMRNERADTQVVVLWDGRAQWRMDIYSDYKGNREALDAKQAAHKEAFKRQTPFIEKALSLLGITQIRSPLLEADDIAAHLIPAAAMKRRVRMVTGDQDWLQLVHPEVTWFDPIRDRTVTYADFFENTGYFDPVTFGHGKALVGDNSDNVPGIPKMGDKTAQVFLAKWKTPAAFFEEVDNGTYKPATRKDPKATSKHPEEFLASPEGRAVYQRNYQLLSMLNARRPAPGELVVNKGKFDRAAFIQLCTRLNFASILREQEQFFRDINVLPQPAVA